ncbi:MAG: hypothetical protein KKG92_05125 [Gammaproteobacteria bacterium]|nr:hypothetical protein [Gammaproteobacteria bacterium]
MRAKLGLPAGLMKQRLPCIEKALNWQGSPQGKFVLPEKLVIPAKAGIQISPSNQAVDFD